MISTEQAAAYLDASLGITLPTFVVQAAVDLVTPLEAAMTTAGYSAAKIVLVQSMATAIVAAAGDPRKIKSQGAPSGASRSFDNAEAALTKLRRSLQAQDTAGITAALIGPDPSTQTLLLVV